MVIKMVIYILTISFDPFSGLHWSQRRKTLEKKTPVETYLKVIRSFDSDLTGQVLKKYRQTCMLVCEPFLQIISV